MKTSAHVEYVGFTAGDGRREYTLRVRDAAGEALDVTFWIPNEAFLSRRVRYQDGPEICFLKMQRQLLACPDGSTPPSLEVTATELQEYQVAHAPAPRVNRPRDGR
jgi:hypothetical protein